MRSKSLNFPALLAMAASSLFTGSFAFAQAEPVHPILLDREALSGLGLAQAPTSAKAPNMTFASKTLFDGESVKVEVYASSSGTIHFRDYQFDEFVHVLNGRAILKPDDGVEQIFEAGSTFVVPQGFSGEWRVEGAKTYRELIVISKSRRSHDPLAPTAPIRLDPTTLSGIGLAKRVWPYNRDREMYTSYLYKGPELTVAVVSIAPDTTHFGGEMSEEFVDVLNGTATLSPDAGKAATFYSGDYFAVPNRFVGSWVADGDPLYRELVIGRTK